LMKILIVCHDVHPIIALLLGLSKESVQKQCLFFF